MKPAIALPWTAVANEIIARGNKIDRGIATCDGPKEASDPNAAYIVHAANAYPKLVEALQSIADSHAELERERGSQRATHTANAKNLLRELGEDQ